MAHDPNVCPTEAELLAVYPVFGVPPYTTGFNAWTATVGSVTAGPYITTIDGGSFVYVATGIDTVTIIRDALEAAITASLPTNYIATPSGIDELVITSLVDGRRLTVLTNGGPTPGEMTLVETTAVVGSEILHQAQEFALCHVCDWGCSTFAGCLTAAVHWLKVWGSGQTTTPGPAGQIASMTQGPFSVSFATQTPTQGSDGWWMGTPEGQQFLHLRRQQGPVSFALRSGQRCHTGGIFERQLRGQTRRGEHSPW